MSMFERKNPWGKGELEFDNYEPLPPTPISKFAREKFHSWGFSESTLNSLQDFTSRFRYDLVPEKIERLLDIKVHINQNAVGEWEATLPNFSDAMGRLSGECIDIARQWTIQMHFGGLLEDMKAEAFAQNKHELAVLHCQGHSRTHFSRAEANHAWNGICLLDKKKRIIPSSIVLIDAAFQEITPLQESGYKPALTTIPDSYIIPRDCTFSCGVISSSRVREGSGVILGRSEVEDTVYALSFAHSERSGLTLPLLQRIFADSSSDFFYTLPNQADIIHPYPRQQVNEKESDEIAMLLDLTAGFEFTTDPWPPEQPSALSRPHDYETPPRQVQPPGMLVKFTK